MTRRSLLWSLGLGFLVVALLLPPSYSSRGPARKAHCRHQLKQIGLALKAYHADYGKFPPAFIADADGNPMHSWRVLILPYLGQQELYDQYRFDEPWDSEYNAQLATSSGKTQGLGFSCPGDADSEVKDHTNYVAVVGPETAMPGDKSRSLGELANGGSETILLVEIRDSKIRWFEPRDLDFGEMSFGINDPSGKGIGSYHSDYGDYWSRIGLRKAAWITHVLMADGTVRDLPESTPPREVQRLLLVNKTQVKGN